MIGHRLSTPSQRPGAEGLRTNDQHKAATSFHGATLHPSARSTGQHLAVVARGTCAAAEQEHMSAVGDSGPNPVGQAAAPRRRPTLQAPTRANGSTRTGLLGLVHQCAAHYRRLLVIVAVLQVVGTMAALCLPSINAAIIDRGVARGDTSMIMKLGTAMLTMSALQLMCSLAAEHIGARIGMGFGRDLRMAMFDRVSGFSVHEASKFGASSLLTRSTNDVQIIEGLVGICCTAFITAAITSVGGIVMASRQDAGLSWVLLVALPVLAVATAVIMSRLLLAVRRMQRLFDRINQVTRDQLSGIRVIRAFARETLERKRFAEVNSHLSQTTLAAARWQVLLQPVAALVINVSSVTLVWFGGMRIGAGHMQMGSLIAFMSYAMHILSAVLVAASLLLARVPRAAASAERITEVLSARSAITEPEQLVAAPSSDGVVRFDNATFKHPDANRVALRDVCFTAAPGTVTAIVGGTGSGKSTLISLLCRSHDVTGGSVTVGGIDVRDYDTEELWSRIGLVPQRAHLFSGTVADNLRYGKHDATDAEMWEALRIAAADGFVAAHPDALRMPVSQGGINLSGGQRRRLAIARAVIRRPAVYVFDDAFSALDVRTQADVWAAVREFSANSTVIVASQRISAAAAADQVVVIDDGAVVGIGTHESLLADCPTYVELAEPQAMTEAGSAR